MAVATPVMAPVTPVMETVAPVRETAVPVEEKLRIRALNASFPEMLRERE